MGLINIFKLSALYVLLINPSNINNGIKILGNAEHSTRGCRVRTKITNYIFAMPPLEKCINGVDESLKPIVTESLVDSVAC